MSNIEISDEVLDRIGAEAERRNVSRADVLTELAASLPPTHGGTRVPAFVAAGASESGITDRIDALLADGFGRS